MKGKHKPLSLLLAFLMVLAFIPVMSFAGEESVSNVITVKLTPANGNSICKIDPEEGYDVVLENDVSLQGDEAAEPEKSTITIVPSQLVRNNSNGSFSFNYSALGDYPSAWQGGKITIRVGERDYDHPFVSYEDTAYGYTGSHGLGTNDVAGAFGEGKDGTVSRLFTVYGPTPDSGDAFKKEIEAVFDLNNADFFNTTTAANLKNPDSLAMYSNGGELTRCDTSQTTTNNKNKEAWALEKAAPFAEQIKEAVDKAEKAKKTAEDSAAAAEEAVKTPGDAAVAAAQKAVDDNNAAQKAVQELNDLLASLDESGDMDYVDNAVSFSTRNGVTDEQKEEAAAIKKANDDADTITKDYPAELQEAMKDSKGVLAQAKSDRADINAGQAVSEAAAAKAGADAAQASVDALKYTPDSTKITKVKKSKKKATVSFKRVKKNVTGYELEVTNKKTGEVKTVYAKQGKKKTLKKTIKGLSKKTKYSVKVRAYHNVNGKTYYAPWSKAKNFKTKK